MDGPSAEKVRKRLLAWFDADHRDMPWRRTRDPYRILVAEVLLQRTRVVSGTPYYERFLARFPDVRSLAAASEDEVLRAWEGLGFYGRARNLHAAAKAVIRDYGGRIPPDAETLAGLPGIGPYTAGAVASIAFGVRVPAVDGNVTRVLARLYRIDADVSRGAGRDRVAELAGSLVPAARPGTFNQALMELGATVCTPTSPACGACPLERLCLARASGMQSTLPWRPKVQEPTLVPVAFAHVVSGDRVLLVRRPTSALLGGLWSLPGGELPANCDEAEALRGLLADQTGLDVDVGETVARVAHSFSHRRWSGAVRRGSVRRQGTLAASARWVTVEESLRLPLVPFHRKILAELESRRPLESFDGSGRSRLR